MVSDRLKKIIFDKLNKDLSKVEIIPHNNNIWFIDRDNKYWYFELKQDGHLWWRYSFFIDFFKWFSLSYKEFEPIISEWVELILNRTKLSPIHSISDSRNKVNEILNYTIPAKKVGGHKLNEQVDEVLNSKVFTRINPSINPMSRVEEALNYKVCKTDYYGGAFPNLVEEALNYKVSTISGGESLLLTGVEDVLNYKVSTISSGTLTTNDFVDDVLSQT